MTGTQHAHIDGIVERFSGEAKTKYEHGQREHGGNLYEKPGMMRHLRQEVLDLVVYQDTMDEQLRGILALLDEGSVYEARKRLQALLDGPTD